MPPLFTIISMVVLAVIAAEDFRHRLISWYWLPVLFLLFAGEALTTIGPSSAALHFTVNSFFLVAQLLLVTMYFSVRRRKFVNIIDTWLGTGDILLFAVLCAAFSPVNYLLFYLLSLVLTITGYSLYKILKGRSSTIPLAGAVALLLLLCLLIRSFFTEVDFRNDTIILQLLDSL